MCHPVGDAIKCVAAAFCALLLYALSIGVATAEDAKALKGVALIIGQSRYLHVTPLANPANDARAINSLLTSLGFDTRVVSDQDAAQLKSDLERFAEEAEGDDVALLYYSGHGIEAGGEDYLVPTDADLSALDDAGEKLTPLSEIMARLQRSVPITILLLDACRTNPFPANAALKSRRETASAPVATVGLAAPRGMSVVEDQAENDSLGMVIGLAAEPGHAALDGEAGGNSPYAAALLRHLSAIKGEEFGTVMRMVTEEVYLATRTRQRPWINESLRRLLYFGGTMQEASGNNGLITNERRQLLLTIADLPTPERKQVEATAEMDGVPLAALYATLRALGFADIPKDPVALEGYLRAQAQTLREMAASPSAAKPGNPQARQLMETAERAANEGAITAARSLLDQAVSLVESERGLSPEGRAGDASLYERRADIALLASDFVAAAKDYERAFDLVAEASDRLGWYYKFKSGNALSQEGERRGDSAALGRAVDTFKTALALIDRNKAPDDWARTEASLGNALQLLGDQGSNGGGLEQAIAAYRAALAEQDSASTEWAMTQIDLGIALMTLGERQTDPAPLGEAVLALAAGLKALPRDKAPLDWARAQNNLGNSLHLLGERENRTDYLELAAAAYRQALEEQKRDEVPLLWAVTQSNLGTVLRSIGERENGTGTLLESVATYRSAIEELSPELAPLDRSMAQNNLGNVLITIGQRESNIELMKEAVAAFQESLHERRREQVPALWAQTQNNLGSALALIGQWENDPAALERSAQALRAVLEVRTREDMPYQWALTQTNLGAVLQMLGEIRNDKRTLSEAVDANRAALLEFSHDQTPQEWAKAQNNLGNALRSLGEREKGTATLKEALVALRAALSERSRDQSPYPWARIQMNIGLTTLALARRGQGRKAAAEAIEAFEAALEVYRGANAQQSVAQAERFLAEAHALRH